MCLGQGTLDHRQGGVGMDDTPLRNRAQGYSGEGRTTVQPFQKIVLKKPSALHPGLRPEVVNLLFGEGSAGHPVEEPFQAGVDTVTGFMIAVIRVTAKEMVELGLSFVQTIAKIEVGHCQLVHVGVKDALRQLLFLPVHRFPPDGVAIPD